MNSPLPLSGVTVVSLEHAIAAPFCSRQLADMGARVIKIERPQVGDFARQYDHRVKGEASHFVWTNRSKESLTLDLKHPEGRRILDQLIAKADVLLQNLAPGAAARMGLSHAQLQATFPRQCGELPGLTKAALNMMSLPGGKVRLPLVDATAAQISQLREDLTAGGVKVN